MTEIKEIATKRAGKAAAVAAAGLIAASGIIASAPIANADPTTWPESGQNGLQVNKTVNASPDVNTNGIVYKFNFAPAAAVSAEEGAFDVPQLTTAEISALQTAGKVTSAQAAKQSNGNQVVMDPVIITAAAMSSNTQNLSQSVVLPDADFFGHAGVYAYTVTEQVSDGTADLDSSGSNDIDGQTGWTNDTSQYKLRLYVINNPYFGASIGDEINGHTVDANDDVTSELVYDADAITVEKLTTTPASTTYQAVTPEGSENPASEGWFEDAEGQIPTEDVTVDGSKTYYEAVVTPASTTGVKVDSLDFVNTYTSVQDLEVQKLVSGDFADQTHDFNFTLTVNLPVWSQGTMHDFDTTGSSPDVAEAYKYVDADGNDQWLRVSVTNDPQSGEVTAKSISIASFDLHHTEHIFVKDLPVGSTYSVSETESNADAQNHYVPTAQFTYAGTGAANSDTETKTNDVTAGGAHSITVNASTAASNTSTKIGAASGNKVVVTNTHNQVSPTGLALMGLPYIIIIGGAAAGLIAVRASNRRKKADLD